MGSSSAFQMGWQAGRERNAEKREHKRSLEDEERKLKVADLYGKATALSKVIPSLSGEHKDRAMKALTDIEQELTSTYHPDRAPGALQKDWNWLQHYISGKVGKQPQAQAQAITSVNVDSTVTPDLTLTPDAQPKSVGELRAAIANMPGAPATTIPGSSVDIRPAPELLTKPQRKAQQQRDDARKAAELDVETAGLTPEEQEQEKQRTDEASRAWQLDWAKRHGISGAALDELTEHIAGMPAPKLKLKPLAGSKPYKGSDGRYYQSMQDLETGTIEAMPMPEGYVPPPSASGPVRAWKKNKDGKIVSVQLDRQTNQEIPGSENADLVPPPYLTGRISTGMYHYVDEDNQVHEIPETRSSGPALGGGGAAPSAATAAPRAPSSGGRTGMAAPTVTGDRVIGTKGSPGLNKARSDYAAAIKIDNLASDVVKSSNSEKDTLFVLSLIRSEAGRVNQKEIDSLFQAGGIVEGPGRWAAKTGHGELPQSLREQLQEFTHAQVQAAQSAVDALRSKPAATGGGWTPPPGAPDASQFPDGYELHNKRTKQVEAVAQGGKWTKP